MPRVIGGGRSVTGRPWAALLAALLAPPAGAADLVASLAPPAGAGDNLPSLVRTLRRDPEDFAALARIHSLAKASHGRYERIVGPLLGSMRRGEQAAIMNDAYRLLLGPYAWSIAPESFGQVLKDYRTGSLLTAWARTLLAGATQTGPDWLPAHIRRYSDDLIGEAVEAMLGRMPEHARRSYRGAYDAMRRRDWTRCALDLARFARTRHARELPRDERRKLQNLEGWVRRRIRGSQASVQDLEAGLRQGLAHVSRRPAKALLLIEPILYESHRVSAEASSGARSAFSSAYKRLRSQRALRTVSRDLGKAPLSKTRESIAEILVRDPESAEALALLARIERKAELRRSTRGKQGRIARVAAAKRRKTAAAQGQASGPIRPSLSRRTRAQALYRSGIEAYARGQMRASYEHLGAALRLDPANMKARRAIERVRKELGR